MTCKFLKFKFVVSGYTKWIKIKCSIPLRTFAQHENSPSTLTLCLRSVMKFFIQSVILLCNL